jgi:hypothetical protein
MNLLSHTNTTASNNDKIGIMGNGSSTIAVPEEILS